MKLSVAQLATMEELTGKLTVLNGEGSFDVELLELDSRSKEKVARSLLSGNITGENQELFLPSMLISAEGRDHILQGQSNWKETPTGMVYVANRSTKHRFKGEFQTIIEIGEYMLAVKIILGNIDFDIDVQRVNNSDRNTLFENVKAMMYPYGTYSVQVLED